MYRWKLKARNFRNFWPDRIFQINTKLRNSIAKTLRFGINLISRSMRRDFSHFSPNRRCETAVGWVEILSLLSLSHVSKVYRWLLKFYFYKVSRLKIVPILRSIKGLKIVGKLGPFQIFPAWTVLKIIYSLTARSESERSTSKLVSQS